MSINEIKITVIEDDLAINQMYCMKLRSRGFGVTSAFNGQDGLKVIEAERPDLVLLDLRMPIMSGEDMLEKLRATDWGSGIRVIVLTNISRDEAPAKLRFLGVDRYIVKAHHTPSQVLDVVHEVIGSPLPKSTL